jgi:hypothetical protein
MLLSGTPRIARFEKTCEGTSRGWYGTPGLIPHKGLRIPWIFRGLTAKSTDFGKIQGNGVPPSGQRRGFALSLYVLPAVMKRKVRLQQRIEYRNTVCVVSKTLRKEE